MSCIHPSYSLVKTITFCYRCRIIKRVGNCCFKFRIRSILCFSNFNWNKIIFIIRILSIRVYYILSWLNTPFSIKLVQKSTRTHINALSFYQQIPRYMFDTLSQLPLLYYQMNSYRSFHGSDCYSYHTIFPR